ncbi:hypothetical protein ACSYAD_18955 [Acaryochloris marina NIES-2412]|uniref:hypothetical protein n=1 Tax=Acaryochloris marina TaxID=155978 RepID=UPI004059A3B3
MFASEGDLAVNGMTVVVGHQQVGGKDALIRETIAFRQKAQRGNSTANADIAQVLEMQLQ